MDNPAPDASPSPITTGVAYTGSVSAADRFTRPTADLGEDLVERLRDHARNVGGDESYERLYGSEANQIADRLILYREALAKLVARAEQAERYNNVGLMYPAAQEASELLSRSGG